MRMAKVSFVELMLLQPCQTLPEGWLYELKLDGYRASAVKTGGLVQLRSRNGSDFTNRYRSVTQALAGLPDETAVDGELVALDSAGRPSFNALQNYSSAMIVYYIFDLLFLAGRSVMEEVLTVRRALLEERVLATLAEPIRYSCQLRAPLEALIQSVRVQGLEGIVAKRPDSLYEPGLRSGAWRKMRLNQRRQFVIGGYTLGTRNFDALVIGEYDAGCQLRYVARTRNGFTPVLREQLFGAFAGLETPECPFVNLPAAHSGRWGVGLTAEKMMSCRWLMPVLAAEFEFVEVTPDGHLRHPSFLRLTPGR